MLDLLNPPSTFPLRFLPELGLSIFLPFYPYLVEVFFNKPIRDAMSFLVEVSSVLIWLNYSHCCSYYVFLLFNSFLKLLIIDPYLSYICFCPSFKLYILDVRILILSSSLNNLLSGARWVLVVSVLRIVLDCCGLLFKFLFIGEYFLIPFDGYILFKFSADGDVLVWYFSDGGGWFFCCNSCSSF